MRPILTLALAGAACADYLEVNSYPGNKACDGPALTSSASAVGCQTIPGEDFSYEIACSDSDHADAKYYYGNSECSGDAMVVPFDAAFGCVTDSQVYLGSESYKCVTGSFTPQSSGAIIAETYFAPNTCPPTGNAAQVTTIELGNCVPGENGTFVSFGCDQANITEFLFDTPCEGAPLASFESPLECEVSDDGSVTETTCPEGSERKKAAAAKKAPFSESAVAKARAAAEAIVDKTLAAVVAAGRAAIKPPTELHFRIGGFGKTATCTDPGCFCCPAPGDDVNNCPDSAQSDDCTPKKMCCCG